MDTRRFVGQKSASIFVQFGPHYFSTVVLQVSANVPAGIDVYGATFGAVPFGEAPRQRGYVDYRGKLPSWQIARLTTPAGAPFEAALKETYRRPGEVGYEVTVTIKAGAMPGPFQEQIILETNDPDAPRLTMSVEGTILWPRKVLSLGKVKGGKALTQQVELRATKPFLVLGIEGGVLKGEPNLHATAFQIVAFEPPETTPGKFRHEIKIKTDLQDAPMTVVVKGEGVP
jgi:hypothetical protein